MRRFLLTSILVTMMLLCACGGQTASGGTEEQGLKTDMFSGLAESKKGVSDTIIAEDILDEGWGEYEFYSQQINSFYEGKMDIQSIEIDKRMTDESTDEIWVVANMQDELFSKTSHLKLSYLNYTQGGWRLETIESYEPTKFLKNGDPQTEEMEYLVSCYFNGYSFEKVEGKATSYTCTFSIDEPHENCQYTGTATVDMDLVSSDNSWPESCYWNSEFNTVDVNVDWSKVCGIYSHEKQWHDLTWDDVTFELFSTNDSELVCSGLVADVTHCESKDSFDGAQWTIYGTNSVNSLLDQSEFEPAMKYIMIVSDGQPFKNSDADIDYSNELAVFLKQEADEKSQNRIQTFIELNDDSSQVVVEILPDSITCTYFLTYDNGFSYDDGEECEMVKIC